MQDKELPTVFAEDLKLDTTDCAIVFKDNGKLEILTPFGLDKETLNHKLLESCVAYIKHMVDTDSLPKFKPKTIH